MMSVDKLLSVSCSAQHHISLLNWVLDATVHGKINEVLA